MTENDQPQLDLKSVFNEQLSTGPAATAAELVRLLYRTEDPISTPHVSPEWFSRIYQTEMGEEKRSCFRDAVLLAFEWSVDKPDLVNNLQALCALASQIGIFAFARLHTQDRLGRVLDQLIEDEQYLEASPLAALIASEAGIKHVNEWTEILRSANFAAPLLGPCVEGVMRHGAYRCLDWLSTLDGIHADLVRELMAEFLPRMAQEDRFGLTEFVHTAASRPFLRYVYTAVARYGIVLANPLEDVTNVGHMNAAELQGQQDRQVSADAYAVVTDKDIAMPEAVRQLANLDEADLPEFWDEYRTTDTDDEEDNRVNLIRLGRNDD